MAGLIEKDLRLLFANKLTAAFFIVFAVALGFTQNNAFILGYFPFSICVLVINTIAYDELDKGYQFLMTLPVDRKLYVREKYVISLGAGVISWLFASVIYFLIKIVKGTAGPIVSELPLVAVFLPVIALFILFMIPMQIKFGVEKSKAIVAGTVGGIGACIIGFAKLAGAGAGEGMMAVLNHMSGWLIALIVILVTVILTIVSYLICVKVMEKKEL